MAPTLKDTSSHFSSDAGDAASVHGASDTRNSQPVALEVAVTVNGARAIEGSGKREPFSENTTTVLIFGNGAVIRLNSPVTPGQLLFLTNEKTRKEVVCQVVKSKSYRNNGYVELEFTEPVSGFWGLRFPSERTGAPAITPKSTVTDDSVGRQTGDRASKPEAARDFKTDIKADSRPSSKADFLAPSETLTQAPKIEASLLQEQLTALLSSESESAVDQEHAAEELTETVPFIAATPIATKDEAPAKPSSAEPAPVAKALSDVAEAPKISAATTKSNFEDEQVKIPAWLQPLARNESVVVAPVSDESPDLAEAQTIPSASEPAAAKPRSIERKPASSAAVFGNALLGETASVPVRSGSGSGKGLWFGAIAAGIVLAAGAAWYFRDSFSSQRPSSAASQQIAGSSLPPATANALEPVKPSSLPGSESASPVNSGSSSPSPSPRTLENSIDPTSPSGSQSKLQTAAITERIPKPVSSADAAKALAEENDHIVVVEPEKRASLGAVRLSKPKVSHSPEAQSAAEFAPTLEGGDQPPMGEPSLGPALIGGGNKEPVAPAHVEVGGDVRPARMLSSVPPAYPALAKAQHISGDVRIDALIDANGRVTTMKVVSGPTLLHQAAMDALRQWKYQPANLDGKPVAMHLTVTLQFRLQ